MALTTSGYVPTGVEEEAAKVSTDELPVLMDDGLKLAVAPVGKPVIDSETCCAFPPVTAVEIADVVELPAVTAPEDGLTDIEKSLVVVRRQALTGCSSHPLKSARHR